MASMDVDGYAVLVTETNYRGFDSDESRTSSRHSKIVVFETMDELDDYVTGLHESVDYDYNVATKELGHISNVTVCDAVPKLSIGYEDILRRNGYDVEGMLKAGFFIDEKWFDDCLTLELNVLKSAEAFCQTEQERDLDV